MKTPPKTNQKTREKEIKGNTSLAEPENLKAKTGPAAADKAARVARLIKIVREIRDEPRQSLDNLLKYFNISHSQFYKDRAELAEAGFVFNYYKTRGFEIVEDKLAAINGFTLSDRLILMFALEHLSVINEEHLAARAMQVARKLAGGLNEPFKSHLLQCFDSQVMQRGFGVESQTMNDLQEFINKGQRIKIHYLRSRDWTTRWREIEPRRIYLRLKTLYLYARTVDETPPQWKVFRLNRIQEIQPAGMYFKVQPQEDDGFQSRMKNAFESIIGDQAKSVSIKFNSQAAPYIREKQWHHSQEIKEQPDGGLIFTVRVADPQEVARWARQFDANAKVVDLS
jgi:predicted DNA-binding transcriptional regulator YafY